MRVHLDTFLRILGGSKISKCGRYSDYCFGKSILYVEKVKNLNDWNLDCWKEFKLTVFLSQILQLLNIGLRYLSKFLAFSAVNVAYNPYFMPLICIQHVPLYRSTLAISKPFIVSLISTGQVFWQYFTTDHDWTHSSEGSI